MVLSRAISDDAVEFEIGRAFFVLEVVWLVVLFGNPMGRHGS